MPKEGTNIMEDDKIEYALIFPVDTEQILTLCFMECGPRLMN